MTMPWLHANVKSPRSLSTADWPHLQVVHQPEGPDGSHVIPTRIAPRALGGRSFDVRHGAQCVQLRVTAALRVRCRMSLGLNPTPVLTAMSRSTDTARQTSCAARFASRAGSVAQGRRKTGNGCTAVLCVMARSYKSRTGAGMQVLDTQTPRPGLCRVSLRTPTNAELFSISAGWTPVTCTVTEHQRRQCGGCRLPRPECQKRPQDSDWVLYEYGSRRS